MLARLMRDDLRDGVNVGALERAREVDELVRLQVLETKDSLMIQLLAARLLETASGAINDEYARKVDILVGNIFASGVLPEGEVRVESEQFRVRLWLNRGEVEKAKYFVERIERHIAVVSAGFGQNQMEVADDDESKITAPTWLLLAEVALAEGDWDRVRSALEQARGIWVAVHPTVEESAYFWLLTALERVGRKEDDGAARLAKLYSEYVLSESALDAAMRARISAAGGFMTELKGISRMEAERWRAHGPEDIAAIGGYVGDCGPRRVSVFSGMPGQEFEPIFYSMEDQSHRAEEAERSHGPELPIEFSLETRRLDSQSDLLSDEGVTGPLVIDWGRCDAEDLAGAVKGAAISELVLRVSSGTIFLNDGYYVDAVLNTAEEDLLALSPRDVLFELYRIAMAHLPRSRARLMAEGPEAAHYPPRLHVRPREFNIEACRRIDVMNAALLGITLEEETEAEESLDNWTGFGGSPGGASQAAVVMEPASPEAARDALGPFVSIFGATTVEQLSEAVVKSVNELGAVGTRCEIRPRDFPTLIAASGGPDHEGLAWNAVEAGPLDLRVGVSQISVEDDKLVRTIMDAAAHRLRVMPGSSYRGPVIEAPNFIAADSRTQEMLETVRVFAGTEKNILISGERGTGKEHIARLIHEWSSRAAGPFLRIDAASINNPELLAAELFGAKKGSYTGANADRQGLVQAAEGGVLFIDEIDESVSVQSALKRFSQFGTFKTVGGAEESAANVRLIIATNRIGNGEALIKEDLRDRFWEVRVPPLRERRGDISPLAQRFATLWTAGQAADKSPRIVLPDSVLRWLETLEWPGNIRQLENTIERACSLAKSAADLTLDFLEECVNRSGGKTIARMSSDEASFIPLRPGETLKERMLEHEKQYYMAAMKSAGGNKTQAAEILGVQRTSLHHRLRSLGLEVDA